MTDHFSLSPRRKPEPPRRRLGIVPLSIAAGALILAASPRLVLAQPYDEPPAASQAPGAPDSDAVPSAQEIAEGMADAEARINAAADDGDMTPFQARRQLQELASIRTQTNELEQRDGELTMTDRQFINDRLEVLSHRIGRAGG